MFYTNLIINSTIKTLALASKAVVTKLRLVNAPIRATAVPTAALTICPDENTINGKVIAESTFAEIRQIIGKNAALTHDTGCPAER